MVRLAKLFGYALFFVLALMYFTPKVALYYFAESKLKQYDVIISDENAVDNGLTLSIEDASLSVKDINSVDIKEINIAIFTLYNRVSLNDLKLASTASDFIPTNIKFVDITYSIFNPLHVSADAKGEFGVADVDVDLLDRRVLLRIEPSNLMKRKFRSSLRNLKRSKDGGYEYAKTF